MKMRSGHAASAAHFSDHFAALDLLAFVNQIKLIVRIHRDNPARVAHDHHVPVAAQLIAVHDFTFGHGVNWRSFRRANIHTVMKTAIPRPEDGIDRTAQRRDKVFQGAVRRLGSAARRRVWRDRFHRQLTRSIGNEYFLSGTNLARVPDAIHPCQLFDRHVIRFADAKKVFSRLYYVVDALRSAHA